MKPSTTASPLTAPVFVTVHAASTTAPSRTNADVSCVSTPSATATAAAVDVSALVQL